MDDNKTNDRRFRYVYAITEKPGSDPSKSRTFWTKCGIAMVNHDQSINLYLETLPLSGKMQIRERDEDRDRRGLSGRREREAPAEPSAASFDFGANIQ